MVALRRLKNTYLSHSGHFLFMNTEFLGGSGRSGTHRPENLINKNDVGAF